MGVFDVLGATRETAHTKLLAWLLDPNEDHGLGSLLSRAFCSGTVGQHVSLRGAVVRSEVAQRRSRPDIVISTPSHYLMVENKIRDEAFRRTQFIQHLSGTAPLRGQIPALVLDGCAKKHMQPASVGV